VDADGLWLAEGLALREGLGLCDALGLALAEGESDNEAEADTEDEGLAEADGLCEADGLTLLETEGLTLADGLTDGDAAGTSGAVSNSENMNTTRATESVSQAISSKSAPRMPSFRKQMYLRLERDKVPDPPESVRASLLPLLLAAVILL
jgi:hypothetical protein